MSLAAPLKAVGFIALKEKPGFAKLYVVRAKTGQPIGYDAVVALLGGGWEGDLSLVTDFPLSDIKPLAR